jgi:hypothetical protein
MGSSAQTNLVEFNVEYYQPGDEIYVGTDEELFEDGSAGGFVEGIKSYEDAIEKDESYKQKEGEIGRLGADEKYIVKSPFYVFYVVGFMGGEGKPGGVPADLRRNGNRGNV